MQRFNKEESLVIKNVIKIPVSAKIIQSHNKRIIVRIDTLMPNQPEMRTKQFTLPTKMELIKSRDMLLLSA